MFVAGTASLGFYNYCLSSLACLTAGSFLLSSGGVGADVRLGEIPAVADDGDACGRRHHLGGVVLALSSCPLDATGKTLDPACWFRQWRLFGVVSSLEALFGLLIESLDDSWSHGRPMPGAWATRAQCTLMRQLQWCSSQVRSGSCRPSATTSAWHSRVDRTLMHTFLGFGLCF
jgi:hypothetical protein